MTRTTATAGHAGKAPARVPRGEAASAIPGPGGRPGGARGRTRPPKAPRRSVDLEPRTFGTSMPPRRRRRPDNRPAAPGTRGRCRDARRRACPRGSAQAPRSERRSTAPRSAPVMARRRGRQEPQGRSRDRALEGRGVFRVPDEGVGRAMRGSVHRPRRRHAEPELSRAPRVLDRRQQAPLEDLDRGSLVARSPPSLAAGSDRAALGRARSARGRREG